MSVSFNAKHGPILIEAEVTGPTRTLTLELLLDTGATSSLLSETVVSALGYDLSREVKSSTEARVCSAGWLW